jgi:hypothetical protein
MRSRAVVLSREEVWTVGRPSVITAATLASPSSAPKRHIFQTSLFCLAINVIHAKVLVMSYLASKLTHRPDLITVHYRAVTPPLSHFEGQPDHLSF